jgi:hypothetical protein
VSSDEIDRLIETITARHARRTTRQVPLDLAREQGNNLTHFHHQLLLADHPQPRAKWGGDASLQSTYCIPTSAS